MSSALLTQTYLVLVCERESKKSLSTSLHNRPADTTGLPTVLDVCGLLNEWRKESFLTLMWFPLCLSPNKIQSVITTTNTLEPWAAVCALSSSFSIFCFFYFVPSTLYTFVYSDHSGVTFTVRMSDFITHPHLDGRTVWSTLSNICGTHNLTAQVVCESIERGRAVIGYYSPNTNPNQLPRSGKLIRRQA